MNIVKTAISLSAGVYNDAEKLRKKLNKSRSELYADALVLMIKTIESHEIEERDNAAYLKNPYSPEEIVKSMAATEKAWKLLGDDDWTEEYHAPR
jgi:metal-responsive CopG/Arc/MetJ family transcriptional regulator